MDHDSRGSPILPFWIAALACGITSLPPSTRAGEQLRRRLIPRARHQQGKSAHLKPFTPADPGGRDRTGS